MERIKRYSPVLFSQTPARTQERNGWEIVLEYENEATGPFLVDLSHIGKWDVQGEDLTSIQPAGLAVPKDSEQCIVTDRYLINRVKWNWATIWHFSQDMPDFAGDFAFTNVTEAYALLALVGTDVLYIMEKVTNMDLFSPNRKPPFLTMGPALHVRSQVVVLTREADNSAVMMACPRGYGRSMAEALLDAGKEWGLRPGGEDIFTGMVALVNK